jgi:hypothetical protein
MYIARIYEKIIDSKNIYGSKKVSIPRPEFIVLYNGVKPYPDTRVLKLSDSLEVINMLLTEWKLEDALAVRGEEEREEGRKEGREEGKTEIARNALAKGFSPDVISNITGLDIAVIKTLSAQ